MNPSGKKKKKGFFSLRILETSLTLSTHFLWTLASKRPTHLRSPPPRASWCSNATIVIPISRTGSQKLIFVVLYRLSQDLVMTLVEFDVFTISFLYGKNIIVMHFWVH